MPAFTPNQTGGLYQPTANSGFQAPQPQPQGQFSMTQSMPFYPQSQQNFSYQQPQAQHMSLPMP
jgi:hypothetical protein